MEDQGKYEHSPAPLTPVRLVAILEAGRLVMVARMERHRRKAAKAKSPRDTEFHNTMARESEHWIQECDAFLVFARKDVLVKAAYNGGM